MGGKPMPSALAACRGGPPASVLASTRYVFGGVRLSAFPQTDEMDVFLSDRGRPHAFRGRARISSGVGMLTRRSAPDPQLRGLATMDGTAEQCFGSAEPPPLGMMGCCASLARPFAKRASGLRLVQSRAVSSVSSSDLTMGGIRAVVSTERRGLLDPSLSGRRMKQTTWRRGLRARFVSRRKDRSKERTSRRKCIASHENGTRSASARL